MIVNTFSVFILVFDPFALKREKVTAFLDQHPDIQNWLALLPGQIFLISQYTSNHVSNVIRAGFPDKYIFVAQVTPISCDGWLPQQVWDFINNPTSVKLDQMQPYMHHHGAAYLNNDDSLT